MRRWYAVFSKPRQEATAEAHLARQGFEVFFPRAVLQRRLRGRWVDRAEPLFPRYLFIHADAEVQDLSVVRSTRGAMHLVRTAGLPAEVPDAIIAAIRAHQDADSGLVRIGTRGMAHGDRVEVVDGPFAGFAGVFEQQQATDRVIILLDILGTPTRVSLAPGHLQRSQQR